MNVDSDLVAKCLFLLCFNELSSDVVLSLFLRRLRETYGIEHMKKPDLDPGKIPPKPSLKQTITMVTWFHLDIAIWVVGMIMTDGPVGIFNDTYAW